MKTLNKKTIATFAIPLVGVFMSLSEVDPESWTGV